MTAIGISKRCCPVCISLLQRLGSDNYSGTGPIHVIGSHRTVTPCTLPPWLPDEVIDEILLSFELELARVLNRAYELKLKLDSQADEGQRSSMSSTGSADSHPYPSDDQPGRLLDEGIHRPNLASRYLSSHLPLRS